MVYNIKSATSNHLESSTSSCTEFFYDGCQNICCPSPCECRPCCVNTMINDHTYSVLKRICRKIIKDYNRQQCRDKYTIFDGGNSVNVRIHRSQSAQGENRLINKSTVSGFSAGKVDSQRGQDPRGGKKTGGNDEDKAATKGGKRRGKGGIGEDDDEVGGKKSKSKGKGKGGDADEDENFGKKGGKSKGKGKGGDDDEDEKSGKKGGKGKGGKGKGTGDDEDDASAKKGGKSKGKRKGDIDDDDEKSATKGGKGKGGKGKGAGDDEDDASAKKGGKSKGKGKGDVDDGDEKSARKGSKSKGKGGDDEDEKSGKKSRKSKSKGKGDDDYDSDNGADKKGKSAKSKSKSKRRSKGDSSDGLPIISDLREKVRKGQEVVPTRKSKSKGTTHRLSYEKLKRGKRGSKKGLTKDSKDRYNDLQRSSSFKCRRLRRASKCSHPTRSDEAKPCDYLRASMEQRELYELCNCPLTPHICQCPEMFSYSPCNPRASCIC